MAWNYSGNPSDSDLDQVRFLVGDTDSTDPLVLDEEIDFAISNQSTLPLAAAQVLRALATKFSRQASWKVGDVAATNVAAVAKAFKERADELDPDGITLGDAKLAAPKFGGLTYSEKDTYDSDTDAVQPMFKKGLNDIPGGPDIGTYREESEEIA